MQCYHQCIPLIVHHSSQSTPLIPSTVFNLPLGLLSLQKPLQNRQQVLQRCKPNPQLFLHLLVILPKLRIEILSVRTRTHRRREDRLNHEGVVGLEGRTVGAAEGGGELFGDLSEVLGECEGGEI